MSTPSILDWSNGSSSADMVGSLTDTQTAAFQSWSDDTVTSYHDNARAAITALMGQVDPGGAASAAGLVSFDTLNQALSDNDGEWALADNKLWKCCIGDHLVYIANAADLAYRNADGTVKAQFTLTKAALDAAGQVARTAGQDLQQLANTANTGAKVAVYTAPLVIGAIFVFLLLILGDEAKHPHVPVVP